LILPTSDENFFEPGRKIVNKGIPIDGHYYLLDIDYYKNYSKKLKDLPMNILKTRVACNEMLSPERLMGLYKCLDRTCTKVFNQKDLFKLHMRLHFLNTEKKKSNCFNFNIFYLNLFIFIFDV